MALSAVCLSFFGVVLASCASEPQKDYFRELPPDKKALELVSDPAQYPYFGSGFRDVDSLLQSIDQSIAYLKKPSSQKYYPYLPEITHERALRSLEAFRDLLQMVKSPEELHKRIVKEFDVYRSVGCDMKGTVLFTGYCTPTFVGSLTPDAVSKYPLYKLAPDLVKDDDGTPLGRRTPEGQVVPYYTREEIERRNLLTGQELVYLNDRFEAFIVHVQGSARIRLRDDGREMKIGYAGKTDRPYTSVGRALLADGKIPKEKLSLRGLKEFFRQNPAELDRYLYKNELFVFFSEQEGGPFGSLNTLVSPYHTIATDKAVFPRGCLAFLETRVPALGTWQNVSEKPFAGFALDQDTGSAIRAAGRCDIYLGIGHDAELLAGETYAEGKLFYIFVKQPQP
jgi:membrane-bound lytic murein transglycosylase A